MKARLEGAAGDIDSHSAALFEAENVGGFAPR
jgi:hypothetical protein